MTQATQRAKRAGGSAQQRAAGKVRRQSELASDKPAEAGAERSEAAAGQSDAKEVI